jgi:hypothetical protein
MLSIKQICEQFNEQFGGCLEHFVREDGVDMYILNSPASDSYCFGDESDFSQMIEELFDDKELSRDYQSWYLKQSGSWEIDLAYQGTDGQFYLKPVCCNAYLSGVTWRKLNK